MRFYVACILCKEMEVDSNLPFKIPLLKLKWCEGQVGALPVFATQEEAETFADGKAAVLPIESEEAE